MEPKFYLNLLKKSLVNEIYLENEARFLYIFSQLITGQPIDTNIVQKISQFAPQFINHVKNAREEGRPWWYLTIQSPDGATKTVDLRNLCEFSHTMVGKKRLDNVEKCLDIIRTENIPGDLVETGVWRGGVTIFMRGYLFAYGMTGRRVFVCDSFEGLPPPTRPEDQGYDFSKNVMPNLAISLEEVRENFAKYDLLDQQVVFVKGWFKDTLHNLPTNQIALLRLDGDLYESTMDALTALYHRLVPGGFIIVDNYCAQTQCRKAVDEFRATHGIKEPMEQIDWTGVFWRKGGSPPAIRTFDVTLFHKNLLEIQAASLRYSWKGIPLVKNPFDFSNYWRLVWEYKPRTIIEIGSYMGGSAMWFADMLEVFGIDGRVITVDINKPPNIDHPRIEFIHGDGRNLAASKLPEILPGLPHPWLIDEDASHIASQCLATLEFFDEYMQPGDILIVEDGIVSDLGRAHEYEGGPNQAILQFIQKRPDRYRLMTEYCDFWGQNVTWNPNGYWIKVR